MFLMIRFPVEVCFKKRVFRLLFFTVADDNYYFIKQYSSNIFEGSDSQASRSYRPDAELKQLYTAEFMKLHHIHQEARRNDTTLPVVAKKIIYKEISRKVITIKTYYFITLYNFGTQFL